jgi:hypothetical protein
MMTKEYAKKLVSLGFSIIPCKENKAPDDGNGWQTNPVKTIQDIDKLNPARWGCRTGYNDIECIDVDLKVLKSIPERNEWWNEYYNFLSDNIADFDKKVVIAKTMSGGFHILYKTKQRTGNKKIASLKGIPQAIIESRGDIGGQFILYHDYLTDRKYHDIDFITDEEREIIWAISKTYNYVEPELAETPKKSEYAPKNESDVSPWDDYNSKFTALDLINDEFKIVRNTSKSYVIKRNGAESPHSGYVFKDSGCMFLFSTGTIYPAEKLLSPFSIYAYKNHHGDFSKASSELYKQGYGTRLTKEIDKIKPILDKPVEIKNVAFPIDIFPEEIKYYLTECSSKLDSNVDFMGVSLLWLISVCVGNSFEIEVKRGWIENGVLWVAVVGKAGLGKTPSISNVIFPLMKSNSREIKNYIKHREEYDFYQALSKKEKEEHSEPTEPKKTQFIANDITLEALVELHQESDNAVGVFKDELAGWLKDMNKYRAGSDLEFWLSCWSGKSVSMNRKTARSSFVEKPFIPVLGGIQPSIFNSFSTEENKENGFMDRMLLSFPDAVVDEYNDNELDYDLIKWYSETITRFYQGMKSLIKRGQDNEIIPFRCRFSDEAKIEWKRMFNKITSHQNNEDENEYLKSMYPKQKSYIPRFAMLIHVFDSYHDENVDAQFISKESILKAEKLSDYFVMNAKKIKIESTEVQELKTASKQAQTTVDKLKAIYENNPEFNRTKVAELLGVSRRTIINYVNKLESK